MKSVEECRALIAEFDRKITAGLPVLNDGIKLRDALPVLRDAGKLRDALKERLEQVERVEVLRERCENARQHNYGNFQLAEHIVTLIIIPSSSICLMMFSTNLERARPRPAPNQSNQLTSRTYRTKPPGF